MSFLNNLGIFVEDLKSNLYGHVSRMVSKGTKFKNKKKSKDGINLKYVQFKTLSIAVKSRFLKSGNEPI